MKRKFLNYCQMANTWSMDRDSGPIRKKCILLSIRWSGLLKTPEMELFPNQPQRHPGQILNSLSLRFRNESQIQVNTYDLYNSFLCSFFLPAFIWEVYFLLKLFLSSFSPYSADISLLLMMVCQKIPIEENLPVFHLVHEAVWLFHSL